MSNIVFVKESTKLSIVNNNLCVQVEESNKLIPISEISVIIIENLRCSVTASVNVMCNSKCIPIVYCDNKHSPIAISNSFNTYHRQLFRLEEQMNWSDLRKKNLFKKIVIQKIKNQNELLKYLNKDKFVIGNINDKVKGINNNNLEQVEAIVSKMYFRELFGDEFIRFRDDEINLSLNYGYSILRSVIKQMIVAKGLIPPMGLWHKSQFNNFNLADDIIEVFRPMIDYVSYHFLIKDDDFTNEERLYLQNVIFQKVIFNNKKYEFKDCLNMYIDDIIRYMNKEHKKISIPITDSRLYEY